MKTKLAKLIEMKGITLYRVWKDTGITMSALKAYVKGNPKTVSMIHLKKLMNYFGVKDFNYFFSSEDK